MMCKETGKFDCVKAFFEVDEFEKWKQRFPCALTCKKLEALCVLLESADNEEIIMYHKATRRLT
jgi:hypothetical protein